MTDFPLIPGKNAQKFVLRRGKVVVLGIDPGLATLGYGVLRKENGRTEVLDYGVVLTPKEERIPTRLKMLEEGILAVIGKYSPDVVAM